jgi:hypothetical protein
MVERLGFQVLDPGGHNSGLELLDQSLCKHVSLEQQKGVCNCRYVYLMHLIKYFWAFLHTLINTPPPSRSHQWPLHIRLRPPHPPRTGAQGETLLAIPQGGQHMGSGAKGLLPRAFLHGVVLTYWTSSNEAPASSRGRGHTGVLCRLSVVLCRDSFLYHTSRGMLARVSERGFVRSDSTTPASVNISTVQQHVIKTGSRVVEVASVRIIKREISKCTHHDHPVRYPCVDAALHCWLDVVFKACSTRSECPSPHHTFLAYP